MKVLDLQCSNRHVFEGWFASEEDFVSQSQRSLVQCPVCADPSVAKKLSAPRLNLSGIRESATESRGVAVNATKSNEPSQPGEPDVAAAWLAMARRVIANTTDVGHQFAEEARKMHYGETEVRSIRGQTTLEQAHALVEEGIDVMPLLLPEVLKGPLQ